MNTHKIIGSILFITLLTLSTFAGTIDPGTPDSKYIDYGSKFNCVVSICGLETDGGLFCASAVVIDKNHILTAAHVVYQSEICFVTVKDKKYEISKIIVHKDFTVNSFGVGDIALGYSEKDFELDVYPKLYETEDEVGKVCSIAGYGLTGTFETGAKISDGKKRAGLNQIDSIDHDMLICSPSHKSNKDYTNLEFFLASGDSGGGLFIDGKLAGINSCIISSNKSSPKSRYNEEGGHTRISKFIKWINDNKTQPGSEKSK